MAWSRASRIHAVQSNVVHWAYCFQCSVMARFWGNPVRRNMIILLRRENRYLVRKESGWKTLLNKMNCPCRGWGRVYIWRACNWTPMTIPGEEIPAFTGWRALESSNKFRTVRRQFKGLYYSSTTVAQKRQLSTSPPCISWAHSKLYWKW